MRYGIAFILIWVVWGCTTPEKAPDNNTSLIVCTTGIVGDAVKAMVGSDCEVRVLMGPGTDPHIFKPTKESLDLLGKADVVVSNGLHLEGRMHDMLEKLSRSHTVIFAADGVPLADLMYADERGQTPDPHLWFDVAIWRKACTHIAKTLEETMQGCFDVDAAAVYLGALDSLHLEVKAAMQSIPESRRVLITAHDAFGYFGRAYSAEVLALQGISTVSEYGVRDVARLVDIITERRIPAIFTETSISSRSIDAVMAGCAKKGFAVRLGGTLYSDALGPKGSGADTYAGMVRHNLTTIKTALE